MPRTTRKDIEEFEQYVAQCTDAQVRNVYEKEKEAKRRTFAQIAYEEGLRRGFNPKERRER